jgi:hypothetical protein
MEAKELRLGNLIYFTEDQTVFEVDEICDVFYTVKNEKETTQIEQSEFSPIPLTEEWLTKFGFAKGDFFWRKSPLTIGLYKYETTVDLEDDDDIQDMVTLGVDLKYVHQLQNLYFVLTGTELTIK